MAVFQRKVGVEWVKQLTPTDLKALQNCASRYLASVLIGGSELSEVKRFSAGWYIDLVIIKQGMCWKRSQFNQYADTDSIRMNPPCLLAGCFFESLKNLVVIMSAHNSLALLSISVAWAVKINVNTSYVLLLFPCFLLHLCLLPKKTLLHGYYYVVHRGFESMSHFFTLLSTNLLRCLVLISQCSLHQRTWDTLAQRGDEMASR